MKIGLDVRLIDNSGIGTTIREFLNCLTHDKFDHLKLFCTPGWKNSFPCESESVPYPVYSLNQHWGYPQILNRNALSLFHMPHYDAPYFYDGKMVVTVHDLIHILYPEYSTKPFSKLYARLILSHATKTSSRIIVVSQNTKKDLIRYFPHAKEKIEVVYPGVSNLFQVLDDDLIESKLQSFNLPLGYLLYVGNLRGSKNTERLIQAYSVYRKLHSDAPPLVLIGKNFLRGASILNSPGVIHMGQVPPEDLIYLYGGASVFVFPSLYEGFGLPPLEAMACGVPVVASNAASLPEVCGDAAEYVDPLSIESITNGLDRVLSSPSRQEELRMKGLQNIKKFTWTNFAEKTWKIYETLA